MRDLDSMHKLQLTLVGRGSQPAACGRLGALTFLPDRTQRTEATAEAKPPGIICWHHFRHAATDARVSRTLLTVSTPDQLSTTALLLALHAGSRYPAPVLHVETYNSNASRWPPGLRAKVGRGALCPSPQPAPIVHSPFVHFDRFVSPSEGTRMLHLLRDYHFRSLLRTDTACKLTSHRWQRRRQRRTNMNRQQRRRRSATSPFPLSSSRYSRRHRDQRRTPRVRRLVLGRQLSTQP